LAAGVGLALGAEKNPPFMPPLAGLVGTSPVLSA
jgi:hypothetical protein